jgi:phage shock protein E
VSSKQKRSSPRADGTAGSKSQPTGATASSSGRRPAASPQSSARRVPRWALVAGGLVAAVAILAVGLAAILGGPGARTGSAGSDGTIVQADGGTWTNITPDKLAAMLDAKDFTLLNVKTPYIGEIAGTDLYIPYDQVTTRAAELPVDKAAKLVVYCRSGHESAIAAQTLVDLGYTNIDNLDGGMNAWTESGRSLVQLSRT